jgi:arylsulfatase A-like enzyme
VLLITLDTTRADALGCYGRKLDVTPSIDRLAREGVVFENARTVAPLTAPAHASIFTGLYPPRHGVRDNGVGTLPSSARTLAELARERGAQTAAFVAASVLDRTFRFDQGFEHWEQPERSDQPTDFDFETKSASEISTAARQWLVLRDRTRPFFVWVHLFDPHAPYEPPAKFLPQARGHPYLGEVAAADHAVGEIVDLLRAEGELERTTVIVVGDHGESLGEHEEATHGLFVYDATLRVPLVVRYPGAARAGRRSKAIVSVVDVFATAARALGVASPAGGDAHALEDAAPDRGVYFECYAPYVQHGWSPLAGWVDADAKLIASSEPELYAPATDRRELQALDDEARMRALAARIAEVAARPALPADVDAPIASDLARSLASLGYASAGAAAAGVPPPHALLDLGAPSPRRERETLEKIQAASNLIARRQFAEALALVEPIVAANPRDAFALDLYAVSANNLGRFEDARRALELRIALPFVRVEPYVNLATALERLGRREEALAAARRALALDPTFYSALELAEALATALGHADEAALYRSKMASRAK